MKKVGTKELYEMILETMFDVDRVKQDVLDKIIPDDVKPQFEAISAIVKEFSDKLDSVTLEDLKEFSEQKLSINLNVLIGIKDEFLNNLTSKYKSSKDLKAMTQEFIKVVKAAKKNSDSQKAAADAEMPEDIKNVFNMFSKFNLEFDPPPPDAEYTQEKAEDAASKVNIELTRLIDIRNQIVKDENSKYRKYDDFMGELSKFSEIIKKVNANKEPEQSDEEKDLQQKLQLFQRFQDKLKELSNKEMSESFIFEEPDDSDIEDDEGDNKLTKDDLEAAASAIGTNLDELKKIAKELQASDSILQTLPPEKTEELRNILTSFNKTVRETRSQEDVFDEIVSNYEKAIKEKVKELGGESSPDAQAYLEKSKTVMSAFKKAFQEKDDELDPQVEEEIKETLTFDAEIEMLKGLIKDVLYVASGNPIPAYIPPQPPPTPTPPTPAPMEENLPTGRQGTAAVGAGLAAAGVTGWLTGLAAIPLLTSFAVGAIPVVIAASIWNGIKDKKRLKKQIPKSLEYGVKTFIKTLYKVYEDKTKNKSEDELFDEMKNRYGKILDEEGNLKLTQIDKTRIYVIYNDMIKDLANQAMIGDERQGEVQNPLNGNINDTTSELGAALEKLANIIKVGNRSTNESRETTAEDSKALYDFLKAKGRDHKQMLRDNFNEREIKGLQLYFSKKENATAFIQQYFKPNFVARAKMTIFGQSFQDALSESKSLEEALKPIIRSVIKEIL